MDIPQENQIILLEPVQRIAVTGLIQGSVLESSLGDGAMEQSDPMRDFKGEFVDRREGRESSDNARGGVGEEGILDSHNANPDVLYLIITSLIEVVEVGNIVLHDSGDQVLLFRQILAIIMIATNDNGGGNGGESLKEMDSHFNPRGSNTVLVVKDVAGDNNERFIQRGKGPESLKEVLKDLDVLFFPGTFGIPCSDMDIGDMKDMLNGH
jgi:hypothetical protein